MDDGADALALVEVGAREEDQQVLVPGADAADPAAVARDAGGVEAGQVGGADLRGGLAEGVDGRQPARTEDEGDVVLVDAGEAGEGVGRLPGELLGLVHGGTLSGDGPPR